MTKLVRRRTVVVSLAAAGLSLSPARLSADVVPLEDQEGLRPGQKGSFQPFQLEASRIFPGYRHWWGIYTPAQQLTWRQPALMVLQDGTAFAAPNGPWRALAVLDDLIARRQVPPVVVVFVGPGAIPDPTQPNDYRGDRSFEYDSLGPRYSDFLLQEILPLARSLAVWSDDPNDHGIGGHSSGAICAFTVAWNRPDQFRKVYSANGSFTHIRGGDTYPDIIRDQPRKPLRIYQWSDAHDLSSPDWGDWATANRKMAAALDAKGYDHSFEFGEGTHDPRYAASRFPDALRWLWRD